MPYSDLVNHFAPSRPGNEPDARDSGRWQELLDSLDVAELTDTFVKRVASIAGYDSSPLPTSEIERTGRMAFSAMLQGLRAGGLPDFVPVANDVGISRARAGIPITSLMTAIRLDYNVLWRPSPPRRQRGMPNCWSDTRGSCFAPSTSTPHRPKGPTWPNENAC